MTIILSSFKARVEAIERETALEALQAAQGSINAAAKLCGLHPFQMRRVVIRYGLFDRLANHQGWRGNAAWRALGDV